MSFSYRRLSDADVGQLKQLLAVFGDAFQDIPTYHNAVPSDEYLASLLRREDFVAVVAMAGGHVIGGLAAYVLQKFEQERKEMYIYDLAVAETYRRQGAAKGMIRELQIIAGKIGAYVIYVQADRGDKPAIKLYEDFGVKEEVYHFDILPA